jgi:lipopolysaccharide export system protein LptA
MLSLMIVTLTLGTLTVAYAQQTRKTETGKVVFDELEWDFENNTIVITGSPALLSVEGMHDAQLRAPRINVNADAQLTQIHGAVATGPVRLNMLTAPDTNGVRRRIEATCQQRATYSQGEATVTMVGTVVADIITLPQTEAEAAHLESEKITVDLRASTLTASPGSFEVTTEMDVEDEEQQ